MLEKQFKLFFNEAARIPGKTGENLIMLLEQRLDNVVFRAGFARTIPAARQLVAHGHVTVNGKVLDIASARVRRGDLVAVRPRAHKAVALQVAAGGTLARPDWLDVDGDNLSARVVGMPDDSHIPFPIEIGLVVEFYS